MQSSVVTKSSPMQPSSYFLGRDATLKDIKDKLVGSAKLLLLNGIGGIGKTEICRKLFHEAMSDGLDGVQKVGWLTYSENLEQTFFITDFRIGFNRHRT